MANTKKLRFAYPHPVFRLPIMSRKQEYIARTRFLNDLPPPPCAPKLLTYNSLPQEDLGLVDSPALLSSVFRKENFRSLVGCVGMRLDLLAMPGVLDYGDERAMFALNNHIDLHPDDRILLRDPGAERVAAKDPGVSFLRRTEYISEKRSTILGYSGDKKRVEAQAIDPESQVAAVEATFQFCLDTDVASLKHPKKAHLTAKKTWAFLPDTSAMDQNYMTIKFVNSAALSREQHKSAGEALDTSIFKPTTLDSGEWISFYKTSQAASDTLKRKFGEANPAHGLDESETFSFKRIRDYEMKFNRFARTDELAVELHRENSTAVFLPIGGRIDLSTRRVPPALKKVVEDNTIDAINFSLTEPTVEETRARDSVRGQYDPLNYGQEEVEESESEDNEDSGAI
ncbi:hypothetical protein BABINDRAFT_159338 [Babjeviella inositovora NRRL Y-12698]|uniref:Uncharacterized protein n=1 Tax=Babjeviella inositovora NRRL Y-12698 TaxID=984486 RepID=A0A1E3QYY7_9ASCO|nr:uncharacterized protein BABINDRAFT_159338 [Babjeviella inositovora NRRL Y-12698]ODQ82841.1 hypothetical protein BABINDRAFT_159338 [Babjeviella inositovora NRRL Y-12698]